jgi:hypothetical protein
MSNVGDGRSSGSLNDSYSVIEFNIEDHFRQLVLAIETAPAFLGSLSEFEDHGERGLV